MSDTGHAMILEQEETERTEVHPPFPLYSPQAQHRLALECIYRGTPSPNFGCLSMMVGRNLNAWLE
jgi:hypothetical protein